MAAHHFGQLSQSLRRNRLRQNLPYPWRGRTVSFQAFGFPLLEQKKGGASDDYKKKSHGARPNGAQRPGSFRGRGRGPFGEDSALARGATARDLVQPELASDENLFHFLPAGMEVSTCLAFRKMLGDQTKGLFAAAFGHGLDELSNVLALPFRVHDSVFPGVRDGGVSGRRRGGT